VADKSARAFSFWSACYLQRAGSQLKSLRKKRYPEHAWLIRRTCVETPLWAITRCGPIYLVNHLIVSAQCIGRFSLQGVPLVGWLFVPFLFPLISVASIYLSSLLCNA
jgi:hypothetical protein